MHAGFDELLRRGSLDALAAALATARELAPRELRHYRAELALRRGGPLIDLLLAVRAPDATEQAPRQAAELVRRAAAAGAVEWARAELAAAELRWTGDPVLHLAAEQLARTVYEGATPAGWRAALAFIEQDPELPALYDTVARDELAPRYERQQARAQLACWRRARGDFSGAAAELEAGRALAPEDEGGPLATYALALDHWLAGDVQACLRAARELRAVRRRDDASGRWMARASSELWTTVQRALRADPPRVWWPGPDLPPAPAARADAGRLLARWLCSALGLPAGPAFEDDAPLPTIAHLRRELERAGVHCLRTRAHSHALATLAAARALVVLEEERPTATGLLLLQGYEARAEVLLLCDPLRCGAHARLFEDHRRRAALHAQGALVVLGTGAVAEVLAQRLLAAGIERDRTLELADLCDVDRDGHVPPHARIAQLAEEASAADAELPMPHKRRGEALLAQLELGHPVELAFERWLLVTRRRFPDAEWPLQSYARYLERHERTHEAIVAWADAAARDPHDERNLLGQARGLSRVVRLDGAEELARRALVLAQGAAGGDALLAEIALSRRQWPLAEAHAELALALAPTDNAALLVGATAAERCGRNTRARDLLERAAVRAPADPLPRLRLLRHHVDRGAWGAATDLAEQIPRLAPGDAGTWHASSWVLQSAGEAALACQAALQGLQRCGGSYELVERAVACLPELAAHERQTALGALTDLLAGTAEGLFAVASQLAEQGLLDEARALAERTRERASHEPSAPWALARLLLAHPELRSREATRIESLLEDAVGRGGGFPYPIGVLGWRLLPRDPGRALELAEAADASVAPALVLDLAAHACERLGRAARAQALRRQLEELLPEGALGPAALLRLTGEAEAAVGLLALARSRDPGRRDVSIELARALRAAGRAAEGLELLRELEQRGTLDEELAWPLLELAEAARAWPELERVAAFLLAPAQRDTQHGFADPWPLRARQAGARLALGDDSACAALCAGAPFHVEAHALLWRLELRLGRDAMSPSARLVAERAAVRCAAIRSEAAR